MPRGRKPGYSPGPRKVITHTNSNWSWNTDKLNEKITKGSLQENCHKWIGAKGRQGNLFGAYKNNHQQMTQANRLIYAEHYPDAVLDKIEVRMTCGNKECCNPDHMTAIPKRSRTSRSIKLANRPSKRIKEKYLCTISEHVFAMLEVEDRFELRQLVQEFAYDAGTNLEFEYRWFKISKENHLLAQIKFPQIQKYLKATPL